MFPPAPGVIQVFFHPRLELTYSLSLISVAANTVFNPNPDPLGRVKELNGYSI